MLSFRVTICKPHFSASDRCAAFVFYGAPSIAALSSAPKQAERLVQPGDELFHLTPPWRAISSK